VGGGPSKQNCNHQSSKTDYATLVAFAAYSVFYIAIDPLGWCIPSRHTSAQRKVPGTRSLETVLLSSRKVLVIEDQLTSPCRRPQTLS